MVQKKRLYQYLRQSGLINTKADAVKLLNAGRVTIDDKPVKNPDFQVNPKKKTIKVDNKPIKLEAEKLYIMLNKPPKFLSHRKREHGKKHLLELIDLPKEIKNTINPVGRLDFESRGLIILTNDGDFANKILQPKTKLDKEYEVLVKGCLDDDLKQKLEDGIHITIEGDKRKKQERYIKHKTKPCKIKLKKRNNQTTLFQITITEGKKRQIREMAKAVKLKVLDLKRIRIGNLKLNRLPEGQWKEFKRDDVF